MPQGVTLLGRLPQYRKKTEIAALGDLLGAAQRQLDSVLASEAPTERELVAALIDVHKYMAMIDVCQRDLVMVSVGGAINIPGAHRPDSAVKVVSRGVVRVATDPTSSQPIDDPKEWKSRHEGKAPIMNDCMATYVMQYCDYAELAVLRDRLVGLAQRDADEFVIRFNSLDVAERARRVAEHRRLAIAMQDLQRERRENNLSREQMVAWTERCLDTGRAMSDLLPSDIIVRDGTWIASRRM